MALNIPFLSIEYATGKELQRTFQYPVLSEPTRSTRPFPFKEAIARFAVSFTVSFSSANAFLL